MVFDSSYYFDMGDDNMLILTILPEVTEEAQENEQARTTEAPIPSGWRRSDPVDRLPPPQG